MSFRNKKKYKQPQTKLVFDDKERVEFLTGFRKRKMERKVKAREEMEEELRQAKIKIRAEQKAKIAQYYANDLPIPEVEHLIEPIEVHDIGDAIVTISAMDTRAMGQAAGLIRAPEEPVEEEEEDGDDIPDSSDEDSKPQDAFSNLKRVNSLRGVKKSLENERIKSLKKTKMFKKKEILDKIKKQKQSKRFSKLQGKKSGKKSGKKDKKMGKRCNRPNQK